MSEGRKGVGKNYTPELKEYEYIIGIPMMEALKVLTLYKENLGKGYSKRDYVKGFEDGYNRAIEEIQNEIKQCTEQLSK